jgi:hypothetical protein
LGSDHEISHYYKSLNLKTAPKSTLEAHFDLEKGVLRIGDDSGRDDGIVAGKGRNISGDLQPIDMDPGSVIPDLIRDRGDGLLKEPGSSAG